MRARQTKIKKLLDKGRARRNDVAVNPRVVNMCSDLAINWKFSAMLFRTDSLLFTSGSSCPICILCRRLEVLYELTSSLTMCLLPHWQCFCVPIFDSLQQCLVKSGLHLILIPALDLIGNLISGYVIIGIGHAAKTSYHQCSMFLPGLGILEIPHLIYLYLY